VADVLRDAVDVADRADAVVPAAAVAADAVRVVVADAAGSRQSVAEKGLRKSAALFCALAPFITFVICSRPPPT